VTINFRQTMSSWFDLASLEEFDKEDEAGMLSSAQAINQIITAEVDGGIPADKIVVGGFSQGCVMALLTGLTTERNIAGIVALSGWLPLRNKMKAMMSDHARNIPIFWGHGTDDPVVKYTWGKESVDRLKELKVKDVTFKSYAMGHSSHPSEIRDLKEWLLNVLPKSS